MNKNWLIVFAVALLVNLVGIYTQNEMLVYIAKPLIVPSLLAYFLSAAGGTRSSLRFFIIAALLFSWLGDVLLMFDRLSSSYFLFGLVSFLIAHIFYILFFARVKKAENIKLKPVLLVAVLIYYAGLIWLLYPHLAEMKIPVMVYGAVISTMFLLALHMPGLQNKEAGKLMMAGALFFVISDSLLAINKFYQPFSYAGILIMLTYGLAQWLITLGAVKYFRYLPKQ
jgi:uncharacterized membrane protein YhhN